jgi:tetratricopeptide (TPR) repeat protein
MAEKPFHIPFAKVSIYSLEELCYYIYHNIYNISEELLSKELILWLENETDNHELADKLRKMLGREDIELRDIVVTILCSADYYNEQEIRSLLQIMDDIAHLPFYEKKKIKADNYLRQGQYGKAAASYRKLLHGSFAVNFTTKEFGNILHNEGIANFYVSSFSEAGRNFKEAYVRNQNPVSLEHYLLIQLMNGDKEGFINEGLAMGATEEELQEIETKFHRVTAWNPGNIQNKEFITACKDELRKAFSL